MIGSSGADAPNVAGSTRSERKPDAGPRASAAPRNLLLVESSLVQRLWLRALFEAAGCRVRAVPSAEVAALWLGSESPRFDVMLLGASAGSPPALHRPKGRALPTWFALDDVRTGPRVHAARRRGALDQVACPRNPEEAKILVADLQRESATAANDVVSDGNDRRRRDPAVRRGFRGSRIPRNDRKRLVVRIEDELALSKAAGTPLCLALVSLENLPEIKVEEGREAADAILLQLEAQLLDFARPEDFVARNTGCEFAVLMPEREADDAARGVARLVDEAAHAISLRRKGALRLRLAFGVVEANGRSTVGGARALLAGAVADARRRGATP